MDEDKKEKKPLRQKRPKAPNGTFDRKSYMREYMRHYMRRYRASKGLYNNE